MRRTALAALLAAGGVASCSLLVDTSDLAGGASAGADAASPDACTGAGCASDAGADAIGDVSVSDATDAPVDGLVPYEVCPSFALFCDDFESGNLGRWEVKTSNNGEMKVTSAKVHRGAFAARARGEPNPPIDGGSPLSNAANISRLLAAPLTSGMLVVRAHMFLEKRLSSSTTFLTFAAIGSDDAHVKSTSSGPIAVDTDTPGAGPDLVASKGVSEGRWACIEWRMTIGTKGRQTVLIDGATVLDADEDTATATGWNRVTLGFTSSSGTAEQEVAFDDVAVATQPLPCP